VITTHPLLFPLSFPRRGGEEIKKRGSASLKLPKIKTILERGDAPL
jgi:hypothetical protein